ncbi:HtaA domain-containing protein [Arthrobacter sp. NPDC089319]|uniref:HtaA domain-containing protein n=1 Tax=Arthrobacter sp. NPDC089319 TaxID=3155915 RepID=UPI00343136E9
MGQDLMRVMASTYGDRDLVWSVKDTFIRYIGSLPDGTLTPLNGAEPFSTAGGPEWRFPYVGQSADDDELTLRYQGELRISGHNGMLLVILMDPWLTFTATETQLSVVELMSWPDTSVREVIATGPACSDGYMDAAGQGFPLGLTATAVELFNNVYAAGTPLGPARLVPPVV